MSTRTLETGAAASRLLSILLAAAMVAGLAFTGQLVSDRSLRTPFSLAAAATLLLVSSAGLSVLYLTRRERAEVAASATMTEGFQRVLEMANGELKSANDQLSEFSAYHESLIESMPTAVLAVDQESAIRAVNLAAENLLGLPRDQLLSRTVEAALPPSEITRLIAETLRSGRTLGKPELEMTAGGGAKVSISAISAPLLSADGGRRGAVLVMRDLSMLKQMELAVLRSERLASLGELAAGVAHEIRNPLNAIRGFADRLARKMPADSPFVQYARIIVSEVDRLGQIVTDVLDFGATRAPSKRSTDLAAVVEEVLLFAGDKALKQKVQLVRRVEADVPQAQADRQQMKQVILNLVLNALQAMPEGGVLTVTTRAVRQHKVVSHLLADGRTEREAGRLLTAALSDDQVEIEVRDTGAGIPPDVLPRLFTPFVTTKSDGTGLGLSVSHKIVEAHGGAIDVDSRAGEGAAFTVRLPIVTDRTEPAGAAPAERALVA